MRIISGEHRGRKLHEFEGQDIRPTTDRVKESIFNLISTHVPDSLVWDVFAGSGALSFEALSRGAERAVCTDKDGRSVSVIKRNASDLKYTDKCEIIQTDCMEYMKHCEKKFDIIFLDPPYNRGFIEPVLNRIVEKSLLSPDGVIVLESDDTDFKDEIKGLTIKKQRKYGRTYITVYVLGEYNNEDSSISGQL